MPQKTRLVKIEDEKKCLEACANAAASWLVMCEAAIKKGYIPDAFVLIGVGGRDDEFDGEIYNLDTVVYTLGTVPQAELSGFRDCLLSAVADHYNDGSTPE